VEKLQGSENVENMGTDGW